MAVIVEDGSIVASANSYVTRAELIAFAAARGVTVADEDATDAHIVSATDYLETFSAQYKGDPVSRTQELSFPRSNVVIDGFEWNDSEIPRQLKLAQMQVALEIRAGEDPLNPTAALPVIKERVEGAVEVAYVAPTGGFKLSKTSKARALINSLLRGGGMSLVLERA